MAQLGDTVITGSLAVSNCIYGSVTCATCSTTSTNACKGWNGSAFASFGSNAFNSTEFLPSNGCAYDSARLNGKSSATAGTASTIALRDASGYLTAGAFKGNLIGNWAEPAKPANTTTYCSFCIYAWNGCAGETKVAEACYSGLLYQRVFATNTCCPYKIPFFAIKGTQSLGETSDLSYFGVDYENTFTYTPYSHTLTACYFSGTLHGYACCAGRDGAGCTFGTAARYSCGCFRPSTWTPTCVCCAQYLLNGAGTTAYKVYISV